MSLETPMLRQYKEIKASYMDAILFFRLGDFYEMFLDDAILASRELQLTLTGRGKDASRIPMCGIPHHVSENYISKLVSRGYKVAICEQVEDVSVSKGITKREVVKVITPGTLIGHGQLEAKENNFLVAVLPLADGQFGISYADISTGEFRVGQVASKLDVDARIMVEAEMTIAYLVNGHHSVYGMVASLFMTSSKLETDIHKRCEECFPKEVS